MKICIQSIILRGLLLLIGIGGILAAPSAQTPKPGGTITGRLVSIDGQPVTDAIITAVAVGMQSETPPSVGCDNEGNFVLSGLKRGTFQINAVLPGCLSQDNSPQGSLHRPGDNVSLTMIKGGVITGRVTDMNGNPMEGVKVNLELVRGLEGQPLLVVLDPEDNELSQTDDRGVYRIYGLPPGVYLA
jgi:large repetitive protein